MWIWFPRRLKLGLNFTKFSGSIDSFSANLLGKIWLLPRRPDPTELEFLICIFKGLFGSCSKFNALGLSTGMLPEVCRPETPVRFLAVLKISCGLTWYGSPWLLVEMV